MKNPHNRLLAVVLLPLAMLAGCSAKSPGKQTWADWMQARELSTVNHLTFDPNPWPATEAPEPQLPQMFSGYESGAGAVVGKGFDLAMRNPDFPQTYIHTIHVSLTGPDHWVQLEWTGELAVEAPRGPFRSAPGRGTGDNDCDDVTVSNTVDSLCTPKGRFLVAGFSDHLRSLPECEYVTWVHLPRGIAMHSHWDIPSKPASMGCIRLPSEAAKLIHNNSLAGVTVVQITGDWRR